MSAVIAMISESHHGCPDHVANGMDFPQSIFD
jgi:hypothetical protein